MSNFVSFLFLIKDKREKGRGTDKNLDGNESEEAEIEEVKKMTKKTVGLVRRDCRHMGSGN